MLDRKPMNQTSQMNAAMQMSAADWVARLSGEPVESDWLDFEAWLQSAPGHRRAYDKAMTLWLDLDRQALPLAAAVADLVQEQPQARTARRKPVLWWGGAMAGAAAVALTFAALNPYRGAEPTTYATAKGERKAITLADGTKVMLNGASKIAVRFERGQRDITLAQGEAAFTVTHDPSRPFQVQVGDQTLRDIGTEFDVLRSGGDIIVTVRQGMVEARSSTGDRPGVSLGAGSRLQHHEGASASTVTLVSADDAFSWRSGRLIYRNRPLSEIASDLDRYGDSQVRVDGPATGMRFTGVLVIGDQKAMVRRLSALLPISQTGQDGVITLHGANTTR
jgi:transmembrane sensor